MAIQHGQCGAWKTVQQMLSADLPNCSKPDQLDQNIATLEAHRPRWPAMDEACVIQLIEQLDTNIRYRHVAIEEETRQCRRKYGPALDSIRLEIMRLREARFWLLRQFNQLFRIPPLQTRLRNLAHLSMRSVVAMQGELNAVANQFHQMISAPEQEVRRRTGYRQAQLDHLRSIRQSPDFAGAVGEWNNAEILARQLPDQCHLFHDVHVKLDEWYFIDGQPRQTAQIDHVAVTQGGVFVIETKLWSRAFAQGGHYHQCPFKQVRSAGKLLHRRLSDMLGESIKVREIIATVGALPPKPADSYVKILDPAQVAGYIGWFPQELDEQTIHEVVQLLSRMC